MVKKKKALQVFIHVIAWLIFLSLPAFFKPPRPGETQHVDLVRDLLYTPRLLNSLLLIFVFYFNYYYAIPKLYFRKKFGKFIGTSLLSVAALIVIAEVMKPLHFRNHYTLFSILGPSHNLFMFMNVYALSFALSMYSQWRKVREDQLNTEVAFLKAQINPHFLFNTLNSIYSLAITKSDKAPDAIVQLSSLMRYSVTDATKEYVPLSKEINYIKDYIALQELRLTERVQVIFKITGDAVGKEIPPSILTPIIENAFKYGANTEEDSLISIVINVADAGLDMDVINNKVFVLKDEYSVSSLGLTNTRSRLRHFYPKKHKLEVDDAETHFRVSLSIQL